MTAMKKIRLGIICPAEIALRRFLPAIKNIEGLEFVGVAVNTPKERYGYSLPSADTVQEMLNRGNKKANQIVMEYGGKIFDSFSAIISSPNVDALYIPLPPALHYIWAMKALKNGKHVIIEKPATLTLEDADKMIEIAKIHDLALHENYMFRFHNQFDEIRKTVDTGELGDVRLYRLSFGFPMRDINDFRYNQALGGGSLFDAGGYTIKCASQILGNTCKIVDGYMNNAHGFDVDLYGSGTLRNDEGLTAQIAFGMDNEYKCELEIWGSKGFLTTGRFFTAPNGFKPTATVIRGGKTEFVNLPSDDAFRKSIMHFLECIENDSIREQSYKEIHNQAKLVQSFLNLSMQNCSNKY